METKDWLLIFGPLVGVMVGGCITFGTKWLELKFQRHLSKNALQLQRLEAIAEDLHRLQFQQTFWIDKVVAASSTGGIDKERLKVSLAEQMDLAISVTRRIGVYLPHLTKISSDLMQSMQQKIGSNYNNALAQNKDPKPENFNKLIKDYNDNAEKFAQELVPLEFLIAAEIQKVI